jgi:hypothetical protein
MWRSMQHRGTRLAILCLLLLSGALAGFSIWTSERNVRRLDEQRESKEATLDRLLSSISLIGSLQQAYAEYGRRDVGSFTRVSLLVDRITTDAAGLRASTASGSSGGHDSLVRARACQQAERQSPGVPGGRRRELPKRAGDLIQVVMDRLCRGGRSLGRRADPVCRRSPERADAGGPACNCRDNREPR